MKEKKGTEKALSPFPKVNLCVVGTRLFSAIKMAFPKAVVRPCCYVGCTCEMALWEMLLAVSLIEASSSGPSVPNGHLKPE